MEIRRLRAFRTIVECGGLTKAAAVLHVTPGALSKAMRQLERETGKALLVKRGRALRLTEHGRLPYHASGPLIEEHARVLRKLDASHGAGLPTLRLATYEVFSTHFLGALLRAGLAECSCQVHELCVGELERAISDRETDVGITYVPVPRPGLTFRPVGEISFHAHVRLMSGGAPSPICPSARFRSPSQARESTMPSPICSGSTADPMSVCHAR